MKKKFDFVEGEQLIQYTRRVVGLSGAKVAERFGVTYSTLNNWYVMRGNKKPEARRELVRAMVMLIDLEQKAAK